MSLEAKPSKRRLTHSISIEDSDGASPVVKKAKISTESDDETNAKPVLKKLPSGPKTVPKKCKYWDKCFHKNAAHLKQFTHPDDEAKSDENKKAGGSSTAVGTLERRQSLRKRTESGAADIPKAPVPARIPDLMLAHKWTDGDDPKGWIMSEKLDGVRAYWNGKCFYSRLKNRFTAPRWFTKDLPTDMTLDGELFGGRGKFQTTVSIVKSKDDDPRWSQITYQIFDVPNLGSHGFEKRMEAATKHFEENPSKYAEVLKQTVCKGEAHMNNEQEWVEGHGGEGLMMRKSKSKYEHCRSKLLLKVKTFHDAEAKVIGYEKSKTNPGQLGALQCVMECGIQFKVGSGLTNKDRRNPPKKGTIITYKFQEYTNSGKPRFPSYIGERIDMTEPKDVILPKKGDD